MPDIFDVVDLVEMTITVPQTNPDKYMITDKLVQRENTPATLYQLGINFCKFKEKYRLDPLMQSWFNDSNIMTSTPITDAGSGGIVCPFEVMGGAPTTLPPTSPVDGEVWVRAPEGTVFAYDGGRMKWLSSNESVMAAGKDFSNSQDVALSGVSKTPTGQTPYRIDRPATLIGIIVEADDTDIWTAKLRDFTTKADIAGAGYTTPGAVKSGHISTLNADFNAGDEVEIYLASATGISFPRARFIFKERG
jgi:hypothetical protein